MTLDDAIQHCLEKSCDESECSKEHRQLAEWLMELKQYRAQFGKEEEPEFDQCEMCGKDISYGFSLCNKCGEQVERFDHETGLYIMKNGEVIDTTKHQY